MDKAALRDHPNLQQVQVEGLAAFYFLARGQVNRYRFRALDFTIPNTSVLIALLF